MKLYQKNLCAHFDTAGVQRGHNQINQFTSASPSKAAHYWVRQKEAALRQKQTSRDYNNWTFALASMGLLFKTVLQYLLVRQ